MTGVHSQHFPNPGTLCRTALAAFVAGLALAVPAPALTLYNLSTTTDFAYDTGVGTLAVPVSTYTGSDNQQHAGAVIGGALFIPYIANAGSGNYRRLFNLNSNATVLDGYNRQVGGDFEAKTAGGFDPLLKKGELIENNGYYQFSLDINEPGSVPEQFLSVDRLRIYVENAPPYGTDYSPLPTTYAGLSNLGTLVYDMDAQTDNTILLDYSLAGGSGSDDMTFLIPVGLFAGFDDNAYVYLYAEHGVQGTYLDGFETNGGGFDEWAVFDNVTEPPTPFTPPIPEPSTALLATLAALGALRRRRA